MDGLGGSPATGFDRGSFAIKSMHGRVDRSTRAYTSAMKPSLAILTALVLLLGCSNENGDASASNAVDGATTAPGTGGPLLQFVSRTHDFGAMSEMDLASFGFVFTNAGGRELVIAQVKPECSCTQPFIDKRRLQPGESGRINVNFNPTTPGQQTKRIRIASNSVDGPITEIAVLADVEPFVYVTLEPTTDLAEINTPSDQHAIDFGNARPGAELKQLVHLYSPDPNMLIEKTLASESFVRGRIVQATRTADDETPPGLPGHGIVEVRFTPDAPWGTLVERVEVQVRGTPPGRTKAAAMRRVFILEAQLFGELHLNPEPIRQKFRAGLSIGELREFGRPVRLTRASGEPFQVLDLSATCPRLTDLSVRVERIAPHIYDIYLTARGAAAASDFLGEVLVVTDVPGEEQVRIGIAGRTRGPAG